MLLTTPLRNFELPAADDGQASTWDEPLADLRSYFGVEFSLWDIPGERLLRRGVGQPPGDKSMRRWLLQAGRQSEPQLSDSLQGVSWLALPLRISRRRWVAASAVFTTTPLSEESIRGETAQQLGWSPAQTAWWSRQQTPWPRHALLRLGAAASDKILVQARSQRHEQELEEITQNLAATYDKISLLYDLANNLRISSTEEELGEIALDWLVEHLPVECVSLQYLPVAAADEITYKARVNPLLMTAGKCPLSESEFEWLIDYLDLSTDSPPLVINRCITEQADWPFPQVRELVIAPLCENNNLFAWLAVFNHRQHREFGTVEANLLRSIGVMLGIHCGNRNLYRIQSEFLANVVQGMTSAIDTKDPYTCGHSDRVARFSVCLAKEMGWGPEDLNTIYMAGLLHDIGKIGVDDKILRKPGRLTEEEFQQVKRHPELGYKILVDIKQLSDVLPAVLHHHEQWDGGGYPHQLVGDRIPEIARIVAVADAYDAMTSDRPYRKGMPVSTVEEIFRNGAGGHWDANIIRAYFEVRQEIRKISQQERANLTLDVQQWS